jgi:hypothetical protein
VRGKEVEAVPARPQRRPQIQDYGEWLPLMDSRGQWTVVEQGTLTDVFRDPDPARRILSVHLGAQAPALKSALEALVRKLHGCGWEEDGDWRRGRILQFGEAVLFDTNPPLEAFLALLRCSQLELELSPDPLLGAA